MPGALQEIGAVQPGGTNPDQYLIAGRLRFRTLRDFENFRTAGVNGDKRFQKVPLLPAATVGP